MCEYINLLTIQIRKIAKQKIYVQNSVYSNIFANHLICSSMNYSLYYQREHIITTHGGSKLRNFGPGPAVILFLDIGIWFFAHFELKNEG
jgi:hypothetical protein